MIRTVEATIDVDGVVHLAESVPMASPRRALVTILDEEPIPNANETTVLSEAALAEDWNRTEEDAAWSYLQSEK